MSLPSNPHPMLAQALDNLKMGKENIQFIQYMINELNHTAQDLESQRKLNSQLCTNIGRALEISEKKSHPPDPISVTSLGHATPLLVQQEKQDLMNTLESIIQPIEQALIQIAQERQKLVNAAAHVDLIVQKAHRSEEKVYDTPRENPVFLNIDPRCSEPQNLTPHSYVGIEEAKLSNPIERKLICRAFTQALNTQQHTLLSEMLHNPVFLNDQGERVSITTTELKAANQTLLNACQGLQKSAHHPQ